MKRQLLYLSFFALTLVGCGNNEPAETKPQPKAEAKTAPSPDGYLTTITKSQQKAVGKIDTVAIDQAIQQFQVGEGRNPKDLDELVTKKYMPVLPTPPFGKKFDYDAKTGTVKLVGAQ